MLNSSLGDADLVPAFALSIFNDSAEDLTLNVHLPDNPSIAKYASLGLLYGLAVLTLDRDGVIDQMVEALQAAGPINEVDATNRIALLLNDSQFDLDDAGTN